MSFFSRHKRRWQKIFGGDSGHGDSSGAQFTQTPAVPGRFIFSGLSALGEESESSWPVDVIRDQGTSGAVTVDYETYGGTAVPGTDYESTSGTLSWAAGEGGSKRIHIPVHDNLGYDESRYFYVRILNATGGATISPVSTFQVTILDDDQSQLGVSVFRPRSLTYRVLENGGSVTVSVNRGGSLAGAVSVTAQTANGTALAGTHYTAAGPTVLSWADGEGGVKNFAVTITNVGGAGGNTTFYVNLTAATGTSVIDTGYSQISILILDDESFTATPGNIMIPPGLEVTEGNTVTATVYREGGITGAVAVDYEVVEGTAIEGTDFTAASGTLSWADNDGAPKTFVLTTIADSVIRPAKTCTVVLSNPAGGATLDPVYYQSTVTIAEKDKLSHYMFEAWGYWEGRAPESAYDFGFTYERTMEAGFSSLVDGVIGPRVGNETNRGAADLTLGPGGGSNFGLTQTPVGGSSIQLA